MIRDIRYSVRMLAKNPGFTAVAVAALALGIGANCAIFSIFNAVMLRPLPYPDSERLVVLLETNPQKTWDTAPAAPGNFADWRERQTSFTAIAASRSSAFHLTSGEEPERLSATRVTSGFFGILGVPPALGRDFDSGEFVSGHDKVIIISDGLWKRRFGADPELIGRPVRLNGEDYTIVGIMPPGFQGPGKRDLWAPFALNPNDLSNRDKHALMVYGRLKPDVSLRQARAEMKAIALQVAQAHPETNAGFSVLVRGLREDTVGPLQQALVMLFGAVGLVLLIACANVANLLLARASARRKEIAVRSALGASQRQIVRQMLTESIVLSLLGGTIGLVVAFWILSGISRVHLSEIPRLNEANLDGTVLLFTLGLSLATAVVFGLAPALGTFRINLSEVLKQGGRTGSGGGDKLRRFLVIAEIALAVALLIGAGLLLKSFARLSAVDPGFQADNVLLIETALPVKKYPEPAKRELFYRQLIERLSSTPGILAAAGATTVPFGTTDLVYTYGVLGEPRRPAAESPSANYFAITPEYFRTLGIPLRLGRVFTERDGETGPPIAIVNEKFARRHWAGENPIGKYVVVDHGDATPRQVVGVIGDIKHYGLDEGTELEIYEPFRQQPHGYMTLVLKTNDVPERAVRTVGRIARELEPDVPLYSVRTMEGQVAGSVAHKKLAMGLLASFAVLALVLAAMGTYGVMSYAVAQRTPEIGMRVALGAQRGEILKLVLRQGLAMAIAGIFSGLFMAFLLSRALASQLYRVGTTDPAVYLAVVVTLLITALAASLIPALRATKVDPLTSLRYE